MNKILVSNDTWFGPYHLIDTSEAFAKKYDCPYFILSIENDPCKVEGFGTVCFLTAIPVYEDEYQWITNHDNGDERFLDEYCSEFEDDVNCFSADAPRKHIIPCD